MSYASEVLADAPTYWARFAEAGPPFLLDEHTPPAEVWETKTNTAGFANGAGPADGGGSLPISKFFQERYDALTAVFGAAAPCTLETWLWPVNLTPGADTTIIGSSSGGNGVVLQWMTDGTVRWGIVAAANTAGPRTDAIQRLHWNHLVGTYTGGTAAVYRNGVLRNSAAATFPGAGTGGPLSLGGNGGGTNAALSFYLAEFAWYPTALSAARVAAHYAAAEFPTRAPTAPQPASSSTITPINADLAAILASVRRSFS